MPTLHLHGLVTVLGCIRLGGKEKNPPIREKREVKNGIGIRS